MKSKTTLPNTLVEKKSGRDDDLAVTVVKNQAYPDRAHERDSNTAPQGKFYIELKVTALRSDVYIPLSVASGKRVSGFMYQIEGEGLSSIVSTTSKAYGDGVTLITLGTLRFVKITKGASAHFDIQIIARGASRKTYKIIFTRIHYKLNLTEARYRQYNKEIPSKNVRLGT